MAEIGNSVTINEFEKFKDKLGDSEKLKDRLSTESIARKESIKQFEKSFQQSMAKITNDIDRKIYSFL